MCNSTSTTKINLKHTFFFSLFLGVVSLAPMSTVSAQGTLDDYNRAYALRRQFAVDSVYHWARSVAWSKNSHILHYQTSTPQGMKYVIYDADKDETRTFDSRKAMDDALGIKPGPGWQKA